LKSSTIIMCQFTCIVWKLCDHKQLSTTPEHTLLCWEEQGWLRQGINCAPAECHPLSKGTFIHPEDQVDSKIARTIDLFAYCDDCKKRPDLASVVQEVHTPGIPEAKSRVIPPEELGSYSEDDASELTSLRDLWWSCTAQCRLAIQNFEEELGTQPEAVQTAIRVTLSNIMGTQLLSSDSPVHYRVLTQSILEADFLVGVLRDYMRMHVPRSMFLELSALIRNKFYHTDARRRNFCQLVDYIKCYNADPSAYKIAIENITLQLARSLGRGYELNAREDVHLKTRDWVDGCESTPAGCCYTPRSSFTAGKKRKALRDAPKTSLRAENSNWLLRIDTDKARNYTEDISEKLRNAEIVHIKIPGTRTTLSPLDIGQGPWGKRDVLSDERSAALLARPERENEALQLSSEVGITVAANAKFMGETLSDSDDDDDDDENKEKKSGTVGITEEGAKEEESGAVGNTEGEVKEKESGAVQDVEEVDDQQNSVRPSDEQISPAPRKGSREDNPNKRPRLE
jgi:hypothetical protein